MSDIVQDVGSGIFSALGHPGDASMADGQTMFSGTIGRQSTGNVIYQADGSPYRTSARNPMKGDDKTYVDIHNINPYAQVLHTYESSHGYRDNSYLIFFPREEWYQERQKYSLRSVAAFRAVVDAMVAPVFEKKIMRTTNDKIFEQFIENADNTGTPMQDIVEASLTHARMLGLTFIIMDNFADAAEVPTVADVINDRKFPYIYEKMPQDVYKWKCTNWGKLEWITFYDRVEKIEDPDHAGQYIMRQYYRRWDNKQSTIYYEKADPKKYGEFQEIIESESVHGLDYLPIYPVLDFVKSNNLTKFPAPLLADLANMAFVLYNMESWIVLLDVYCFPILTLPPMDGIQMAVSATNAIQVPNDAKFSPQFISPPTSCLEVLLKSADRLEDKIYKAANQLGVSGTRTSTMISGVSKEWDFRASNSLLQKTALAAENLEKWLVKTFSDYVGHAITFEVEYQNEFVQAYSNQRVEQIMNLTKTPGIPDAFATELWKEAAKVFFDDDPDMAKKINDAIDANYKDQLASESDDINAMDEFDDEGKPIKKSEGKPDNKAGQSLKEMINALKGQFGDPGKKIND
jgi:hypothetical protein